MQLTSPLEKYLKFPRVPEANYNVGIWYEQHGQNSPAFSFYLRAAEFAEEQGLENPVMLNIAYESLCRAYLCLSRHAGRDITCEALVKFAISLDPSRPEAYYLLSKFYARKENWVEVYTLSKIGYQLNPPSTPTLSDLEYRNPNSFLLLMAVSAYEWGRATESRRILQELADNQDHLTPSEVESLDYHLRYWGVGIAEIADVPYIAENNRNSFNFLFEGFESIEKNNSQAYQDMFILSTLNGKREGTYLEIGSEDPVYKSNTYLLENKFDWKGISVEIDAPEVAKFRSQRKNPVICADATKINYTSLLSKAGFGNVIDYLQIDTEPSSTSFEALLSIPFDKYDFRVITFEHDHAVDVTRTYREKSRRYLRSLGYKLVVPDIGPTDWYPFEDWWVKPELVDMERLEDLGMIIESTPATGANDIRNYFLG
jgi:hypothetical protein